MENEVLGSVKPSTYQVYRRHINKHLLPKLGKYDLSELTPIIIHGFVEELEAAGLASCTVKGVYRLLAAAMRFAQEEGQIAQNPCRKIKIQCMQRAEQRVLNRQEQEAIRSLPEAQQELSVLLALYTGMRLGEVCALKWLDIDWEKRTITICRTAQRVARMKPETGGKDDVDDWLAQVHTITAGITGVGVPAGAAEETHGKSDVGICVRRFRSGGRAAHSSETLSKDHEQAGNCRGPLSYAEAQLRHTIAGTGS